MRLSATRSLLERSDVIIVASVSCIYGLGLPDLWYAGLLSIFLLFLYQKHFLAAALMLFPLYLSRESTILVLFCLLVVGWRRMSALDYGVAIVASFSGMRIVKFLASASMANREHLDPNLYLAGKVPWNFAKNVLGIPLWNNLNQGNCAAPQWRIRSDGQRMGVARATRHRSRFLFAEDIFRIGDVEHGTMLDHRRGRFTACCSRPV